MNIFLLLSFPFICTSIGAASVFFFKDKISQGMISSFLSLAAGIMVSASMFSLILPAFEKAEELYVHPAVIVSISFILGGLFLYVLDYVMTLIKNNNQKNTMFVFAITLHNIPEGMAVGLMCGLALTSNNIALLNAAVALSIGIGVQNIPEGAAISLPLRAKGKSKVEAFLCGVFSGIVEPISAFVAIVLINYIQGAMPFLLAFSAGCMIYVVVEELVPQAHLENNTKLATLVFIIGFTIMMFLDTTFG